MYPYDIFPGIDLYTLLLCAAIVAAIVTFRLCADRAGLSAGLQNLCVIDGAVSIAVGYFFAVFFQALYNIGKYGEFRIDAATGATFYGGLIGGAACFLLVYFVVGRFLFRQSGEHLRDFFTVSDIAAASIAIAHSIGRIGCLMAGCCHGAQTDRWYGIYMVAIGRKVIPTQLYEALFLLALFLFFLYRLFRKKSYNLCLYMALYGVWRFLVEYARDDYRGTTLVSFLTPSQLIALMMVAGAGALYLEMRHLKKKAEAVHEEKA